jgi:hypothetical protein
VIVEQLHTAVFDIPGPASLEYPRSFSRKFIALNAFQAKGPSRLRLRCVRRSVSGSAKL